ncbi:MAG TPA: T9SS type A sorting domain-containing protein, partial [Ignavibacteria bacterium]
PWNATNLGLRKSTDKGVNWQYNYQITNTVTDKPCICGVQSGGIYTNNLYIAWQAYPSGLHFARSVNQGVNWSSYSLGVPANYYCPYLSIGPSSTTPGGIIYYGFSTSDNFDSIEVRIKKSIDAGITFSPEILAVPKFLHPLNIKNITSANACIQMSADNSYGPYRGNVYIVFAGKGTGATDKSDIFFVKSTNYGNNWSTAIRLNDDNTLTDQFLPAISVDKNGKIYIIWYDSRVDLANNIMTLLYGTVSSNGGTSFIPNIPVSTTPFNPTTFLVYGGFFGHYISVSAIENTAIAAWTDGRNNNYGSYVGYFPDFAMTVNPDSKNIVNNDSSVITVKIPDVKGPYNSRINFSYSFDSLPASGNINVSFVNGKDFITIIPDSAKLKIVTSNNVTPGTYKLNVIGRSETGVPVHKRIVNLLINYNHIFVGTNRNDTAVFKVNGTLYTRRLEFYFPNNTNLTVQAMSPFSMATKKFVFTHWSDNGDTTHRILLNNSNLDLMAYYKLQCKLTVNSSQGNTTGGNIFFDSSASAAISVNSRTINNGGTVYRFRGWTGNGYGSYTSPDSTGLDSAITINNIINPLTETVRWMTVTGIINISSDIPKEYKLYQNYPNPFNPVTKIKFDLAGLKGFASIRIYDIMGREIKVLLNEILTPGRYEVTFDGSNLASGIYFYILNAAGYSETKRMVFIK